MVRLEAERNNDYINMIFKEKYAIPSRPCEPNPQPGAYVGPKIDWWVTDNLVASMNATSRAAGYGILNRMPMTRPTLNSGFLLASPNKPPADTPDYLYSGHVFGLYGQGTATMPRNGTAFIPKFAPDINDQPNMMVSIFPAIEDDAAGLLAGQTTQIKFYAIEWRVAGSFNAPD